MGYQGAEAGTEKTLPPIPLPRMSTAWGALGDPQMLDGPTHVGLLLHLLPNKPLEHTVGCVAPHLVCHPHPCQPVDAVTLLPVFLGLSLVLLINLKLAVRV